MDVKKFNSRKSFMVPILIGVMLILAVIGSEDQWDDIYLSPTDSKQFVEVLKSINPQIKVQQ